MPDDYDNDVEKVLISDAAWWAGFQYRLGELTSNADGSKSGGRSTTSRSRRPASPARGAGRT